MRQFWEKFTPERRQQIQLFFSSLAPLLILGGFATQLQTEQTLIIIGAVLQALGALLALLNVRKGDWGAGWAVIRGAVYALAATVSPALVLLGLYDEETNATLLTALSLALTALSSGLAIFIGKKQELVALESVSPPAAIEAAKAQLREPNGIPLHEQGLD